MRWGKILIWLSAAPALGLPTPVHAQSAQISGLGDVAFGALNGGIDQSRSQNVAVCSFRGRPNARDYSVVASGSGSGGAFHLASGPSILPFDVLWSDSPGQTGGRMLQAGIPASGFRNAATGFTCDQRPDTASLTVTLRAADLSSARSGDYSGSLQITIVPE